MGSDARKVRSRCGAAHRWRAEPPPARYPPPPTTIISEQTGLEQVARARGAPTSLKDPKTPREARFARSGARADGRGAACVSRSRLRRSGGPPLDRAPALEPRRAHSESLRAGGTFPDVIIIGRLVVHTTSPSSRRRRLSRPPCRRPTRTPPSALWTSPRAPGARRDATSQRLRARRGGASSRAGRRARVHRPVRLRRRPASDADARDPPDPTEGIAATIDALKTLARREVAEAAVRARGDHHLGDHDGDEAHAKRPRMTAARTRRRAVRCIRPARTTDRILVPGEGEETSPRAERGGAFRRERAIDGDGDARQLAHDARARAHPRSHRDVAVEASRTHARRAAWRREVITTHHKTLRKTIARRGGRDDAKGVGTEANLEEPTRTSSRGFQTLRRRATYAGVSRSVFGARRRVARTRVSRWR